MNRITSVLTRRRFLAQGSALAGVLGITGVWSGGARAAGKQEKNPFAYDVGRIARTDPKLVQYEETARFSSPHEDPRRLAIGTDGRVYLAAGKYVAVLDPNGQPVSEIAFEEPVRCLALASTGDLLAGLKNHVEVFDAKGGRRARWESLSGRAWLTGLAVGRDDVYAADAGNRIVLRYDYSGKLLGRIGTKDKDRNIPGFIVPSPFLDVEMHRDGMLRVNNPGRHRIEGYTREGDFEFAWGKASAGIEGFCGCCNPISIALLPDGGVVTCEKGLPRVKVYRADGAFDCVVAGPESFPENARATAGESLSDGTHGGLDAAVDSAGRIYILDLVKGDIRVMRRKGKSAREAS